MIKQAELGFSNWIIMEVFPQTVQMESSPAAAAVHYVFVDGYLVAAPQRSLLESAIQNHDSGYVLVSSPRFRNLMPADGEANRCLSPPPTPASLVRVPGLCPFGARRTG